MLLVGRDEQLEQPVELRAGPVTALLYGEDLRHVRVGDVELVQRVYMAVRDAVWNTIPGVMEDLRIETDGEEAFDVTFASRHTYADIDFSWRARISGDADGSITYEMVGAPLTAFQYAKIGLNVHHPLPECAGRPYRAYRNGEESRGHLPTDIEPQLFVDGTLTALFPPYDSLVIELENDVEVRFDFQGDLFEMQDHRNWTDANLKTYGTPLALPWPFDAQPGAEIRQSVRVTYAGPAPASAQRAPETEITVGGRSGRRIPPIGLGLAETSRDLTPRETELLRVTDAAHVRVDVVLDEPDLADRLERATAAARALSAPLELGVFTGEADAPEARRIANLLNGAPVPVARVFVFAGGRGFSSTSGTTTPAAVVTEVRNRLSEGLGDVPFIGGTNQFFTEINRNRPETEGVDGVVYSINPQVHASDDLSLMENLDAQADTVAMAGKVAAGLPVFVSPVTLIGRYGPFPGGPPVEGGLPGNVDLRHCALFGAAWTVASIRRLSDAGAAAITYYETSGPRGLIHDERDPSLADAPALPFADGDVFPVYHVFADLASARSRELLDATSADPTKVDVLAVVRDDGGYTLLLANLTQIEQPVAVKLAAAGEASLRVLDASVARIAIGEPDRFRGGEYDAGLGVGKQFKFNLGPYALARIDVRPS